jgi:hypothetical protein
MTKTEKVVYLLLFSSNGLTMALVALGMKFLKVDLGVYVCLGLLIFVVGYAICKKIWGKGRLELIEDSNLQDTEKPTQENKK